MFCRSKVMATLGAAIFFLALPCTSMASTSTEIDSVTINISSYKESYDSDVDVDVTTDSGKYYVDKVSVTYESDVDWADEEQPILKVYLKADDGYTFLPEVSEKDLFSGVKGRGISGKLSKSQLISYIILDVESDEDINVRNLDVRNLEWDEMTGTARWVGDAYKYQVKLYHGGRWITSKSTENQSYDFSSYITEDGYYTYKVRAIPDSSNEGKWKKSNHWHVTSDEAKEISSGKVDDKQKGPGISSGTGAWLKNKTGWRYRNADSSNTVSNWQNINDKWYYFNESGYMVTGWINWKTKWYYCGVDGAMYANTITPDGYYVDKDGAWIES